MKSTGIVRQVDPLGRIVIPKELRKTFNISEGDALEIFTEGESIILKKYVLGCQCCGEIENLTTVLDVKICPKCLELFKKAAIITDTLRTEG